jgi:hypothetical protein
MSIYNKQTEDVGYSTGATIPPEILKLLQSGMNGGYWTGPAGGVVSNGTVYNPVFNNGVTSVDSNQLNQPLTGWESMTQGAKPGDYYTGYNLSGNDGWAHPIMNGNSFKLSDFKDLGQAALTVLSMYGIGAGLGAMGAGSAGGIGGSGIGAGTAGVTGLPAGADASAFWDMGAAPGAGVPNTAVMGAGGAGMGGAGGATDIFGGNGMATGFTDTGTAGGASALGDSFAGSGAVTGAAGAAGPASSWLSNLIPNGAGSLLGPAASILGAVAGSKPQTTTQTQTHDIPAQLKPYVYGQGGLLDSAAKLFQQQTAPGAMPGYAQMQNVGMGLLSQPMAGNGFNRFYGGR